MGYVFDAMNRDDDKPRPTPASSPAHNATAPSLDPTPAAPIDLDRVDDRLVALTRPASVMAEEYRAIRTSLLAKWEHRRHIVHTITSATPQEGKTITSLNLGLIFAELRNRRTLVIEGDLRLPQFANLLALPPSAGVVNVLQGEAEVADCIQTVGEHKLHVLCAGKRIHNQAVQLLSGSRMTTVLKQLRDQYDHVIIDTPPVVELADAGILGAMSDEVMLIARMNRTPRSLIEQAIRTLQNYNAPVAGLVATDHTSHRQRYYYYRYGYRYHYRYYSKAA